ncbi:MAG: hypothetical protein ACREUY_04460 [Burkholderiales bacterium]
MPAIAEITVPRDRTDKQPPRAFCRNPECLADGISRGEIEFGAKRFEFEVEHAHVACPKCGATESPYIGLMSLIHFMHRNAKGLIKGVGGLRYQIACDERRWTLATLTNDEAVTDQLVAVNCPGCLKAAAQKKLVDKQGVSINAAALAQLDKTNPG